MAKNRNTKSTKVVVPSECSVCGQRASAVAGTEHNYCKGIRFVKPVPGLFANLSKPDNKGKWIPAALALQLASPVPDLPAPIE